MTDLDLKAEVAELLNRRPAAGLAVGVVRDAVMQLWKQGLVDLEPARSFGLLSLRHTSSARWSEYLSDALHSVHLEGSRHISIGIDDYVQVTPDSQVVLGPSVTQRFIPVDVTTTGPSVGSISWITNGAGGEMNLYSVPVSSPTAYFNLR
jgi:hypothetical protein